MTELEKIKRAKMYMDKLANGINPLDDIMVADDDIINNVRLSRCFFFISDVLEKVIKNGGIIETSVCNSKNKKQSLKLSYETLNSFEYSETPLTISDIAKRINSLYDTNIMLRLKTKSLTTWLLDIGMLKEENNEYGKTVKYPTDAGNEIGILKEQRASYNGGIYNLVLYNRMAQQFIIDNFEAIAEINNTKPSRENQGLPWSKDDEVLMIAMFRENAKISDIAKELKRTSGGVRARLQLLGLLNNNQKDVLN